MKQQRRHYSLINEISVFKYVRGLPCNERQSKLWGFGDGYAACCIRPRRLPLQCIANKGTEPAVVTGMKDPHWKHRFYYRSFLLSQIRLIGYD